MHKRFSLLFGFLTLILSLTPQSIQARSVPFRKSITLEQDTLCNRTQRKSFPAGAIPGQYVFPLTTRDINYIKDVGASLVILQGGPALWANVAKIDPYTNGRNPSEWNNPNYNWDLLDRAIGLLQLNNIEPVIQSFGTPSWANGITTDMPWNSDTCFDLLDNGPVVPTAHSGLTEYANFMQAVATRYDGNHARNPYRLAGYLKVNRYILWNEPNFSDFWTEVRNGTKVSDVAHDTTLINKFVTFNNQAYDRIKSANSSSFIYGGAVCGPCAAFDWLKLAHNAGMKLDGIAGHPYPENPNVSPSAQVLANPANLTTNNIGSLRQVVDALPNWVGKPLYMTEAGYRSHENNLFPQAEANDGPWLTETLNLARAVPSNFGWSQFLLYPEIDWGTGLVYDSGSQSTDTRYPSYSTFKSFTEVYPTDLNNDKTINSTDTNLFVQQIANLTSSYKEQADLNNDNKINSLDFALSGKNRNSDFPLSIALPSSIPLPSTYDEVTVYPNGKQILIYGTSMWERPDQVTKTWSSGPIDSLFIGQSSAVTLPTTHIDSYCVIPDGQPNAGGITITNGNRRWYRGKNDNTWITSTLSELWVGYTSNYPLPTTSIDSNTIIPTGMTNGGGQLITSGNRYWWRSSQTNTAWTSGTLAELFAGHTAAVPLPTTKIDAIITNPNISTNPGWQFIFSGNRYWSRTSQTATTWATDTIPNSLTGHQVY